MTIQGYAVSVAGVLTVINFAFTLVTQEFVYAMTFISGVRKFTVSVGVPTFLVRGDVYFWGSLMAGGFARVQHDAIDGPRRVDVPARRRLLPPPSSPVYTSDVQPSMVEAHVRKVGVVEARQRLRALLDEVAAGKEVCVLRRGKEVARLVPPKGRRQRLPSLRAFRRSLRVRGEALSATVVRARADARY